MHRKFDFHQLSTRVVVLVALGVLASLLAINAAALVAFESAVAPELNNRIRLIGAIVQAEIQQAVDLGVPVDAIADLERHLADTLQKFEEVQRIAVRLETGEVLDEARREDGTDASDDPADSVWIGTRDFVLPVLAGNNRVGEIVVETNTQLVRTRLREVFLDVLVVALVAIVAALELVQAVTARSVRKPMEQVFKLLREQAVGRFEHVLPRHGIGGLARAVHRFNDHANDLAERMAGLSETARRRLRGLSEVAIASGRPSLLRLSDTTDVRLALFLFAGATEVSAAFLPLYAIAAERPAWLSPALAAALPLMGYLLAVAMVSPAAGWLAARFGPRWLFVSAVVPCVVALIGMSTADGIAGVTGWRTLLAVGYALGAIACQEYAQRASAGPHDAHPVSVSVAAIFGGVFCGSAFGGLLAERLGYTEALLCGAALVVLAGLLGWDAMRGRAGAPAAAVHRPSRGRTSGNGRVRLVALLLGVAVPLNAVTAIVVWYLTPLELAGLDSGPAEVARVVMLYYLATVLVSPAAGRLSDRWAGPFPVVLAGGLLSAAALIGMSTWSGFWSLAIGIAMLGLGHAILRAPLYSHALRLSGGSARVLGALRTVERLGALVGLLMSAVLAGKENITTSLRGLGVAVLVGLFLYAIFEFMERGEVASEV